MIPESGEVGFDDVWTELGLPTDYIDFQTFRTAYFGGTGAVYIGDLWGFGADWYYIGNPWLEVTGYSIQGSPPTDYPQFNLDNHSQYRTQSETLYYNFKYLGSSTHSGSVATGTVSINSTKVVNGAGPFYAVPYDEVLVSYDNSNWFDIY